MSVSNTTSVQCEPFQESEDLVFWFYKLTGSCVYGNLSLVSLIAGYLSLGCWLWAQLPQVIANYRNHSVEGISPYFLFNWFMGDFTNFLGCFLTHQLPFQTALALYYLFIDVILGGQYYYYTRGRGAHRAYHRQNNHRTRQIPENMPDTCTIDTVIPDNYEEDRVSGSAEIQPINKSRRSSSAMLLSSSFLSLFTKAAGAPISGYGNSDDTKTLTPDQFFKMLSLNTDIIGAYISWTCTILYLTSRSPQLYKNYKRKSTSGVSILLFMAALSGNIFYTISILTSPNATGPNGSDFIIKELPFLIGSAGTVGFDLIMLFQWWYYGKRERKQAMIETYHDPTFTSNSNTLNSRSMPIQISGTNNNNSRNEAMKKFKSFHVLESNEATPLSISSSVLNGNGSASQSYQSASTSTVNTPI